MWAGIEVVGLSLGGSWVGNCVEAPSKDGGGHLSMSIGALRLLMEN